MSAPRRICVLGNAHAAPIRAGWARIAEAHPGLTLDFFAAPHDGMSGLALRDGALVPDTDALAGHLRRSSGGQAEIALARYDAVVLVALNFGPRRVLELYRGFRPPSFEWRAALPDLPTLPHRPDPVHTIAERLFDMAAEAALRQTTAVRLAEIILTAAPRPVALIAAPFVSSLAADGGAWDGILGADDAPRLARRYRMAADRACPPGVALTLQPEETTAHAIFTAPGFAAPARRGRRDLVHPSAELGALLLGRALGAIVPGSETAVSAA